MNKKISSQFLKYDVSYVRDDSCKGGGLKFDDEDTGLGLLNLAIFYQLSAFYTYFLFWLSKREQLGQV